MLWLFNLRGEQLGFFYIFFAAGPIAAVPPVALFISTIFAGFFTGMSKQEGGFAGLLLYLFTGVLGFLMPGSGLTTRGLVFFALASILAGAIYFAIGYSGVWVARKYRKEKALVVAD